MQTLSEEVSTADQRNYDQCLDERYNSGDIKLCEIDWETAEKYEP